MGEALARHIKPELGGFARRVFSLHDPMGEVVAETDADRRNKLESDVVAQWQDFVDHGSVVIDLPTVTATARK